MRTWTEEEYLFLVGCQTGIQDIHMYRATEEGLAAVRYHLESLLHVAVLEGQLEDVYQMNASMDPEDRTNVKYYLTIRETSERIHPCSALQQARWGLAQEERRGHAVQKASKL